jgi:hypothetical protein
VLSFITQLRKLKRKANKSIIYRKSCLSIIYGALLAQGQHIVPIDYTARISKYEGKIEPSNALSLWLWYESSLTTPEVAIARFYDSNGADVKSLDSAPPKAISLHYFRILDMLLMVTLETESHSAIEGLVLLSEKASSSLKKSDGSIDQKDFLDAYASVFSCRGTDSSFHRRIMDGWGEFLNSEGPRPVRRDRFILEFLLNLIVKSLYLTDDHFFGGNFAGFVTTLARSLVASQEPVNRKYVTIFARFFVLLFDIRLYAQAVIGISSGIRAFVAVKNVDCLQEFVAQTFRPRIFYIGLTAGANPQITTFFTLTRELLGYGKTGIKEVVELFINAFWYLTDECRHRAVNRTYEVIEFLSPLDDFPPGLAPQTSLRVLPRTCRAWTNCSRLVDRIGY